MNKVDYNLQFVKNGWFDESWHDQIVKDNNHLGLHLWLKLNMFDWFSYTHIYVCVFVCVWKIIGKMISLSCQSKCPGRCLVDFCHRDSIGAVARVTVAWSN